MGIIEKEPQVMQQDLFVPDAIYESDNELEIPTLRIDMQATMLFYSFRLLW